MADIEDAEGDRALSEASSYLLRLTDPDKELRARVVQQIRTLLAESGVTCWLEPVTRNGDSEASCGAADGQPFGREARS